MIQDGFLKLCSGADMTVPKCNGTTFLPHMLPDPLSPIALLTAGLRVTDLGQGYPLAVRFKIATALVATDASLVFSFALVAAGSEDFTSFPFVLAQTANLFPVLDPTLIAEGATYELLMPKLPSIAPQGRSHFGVGLMVPAFTPGAGIAMFSAGTLDVSIVLDTDSNVPLTIHPSGWRS